MNKVSGRRGFLLGGVAALAMLAGVAEATIPLTMVDDGLNLPSGTKITGAGQAQSNSIVLPVGAKAGNLALFYGIVNTSSSSSGILGISSGPTGWTNLSGAGNTVQDSTSPVFVTAGLWWKLLTAADINAGTVTFGLGTLATAAACGVMCFGGAGTAFTGIEFSTFDNLISRANTDPALPVNAKLMILIYRLRADLAETITPPAQWQTSFPNVNFAGAFFFCDPLNYAAGAHTTTWTTHSGGIVSVVSIT